MCCCGAWLQVRLFDGTYSDYLDLQAAEQAAREAAEAAERAKVERAASGGSASASSSSAGGSNGTAKDSSSSNGSSNGAKGGGGNGKAAAASSSKAAAPPKSRKLGYYEQVGGGGWRVHWGLAGWVLQLGAVAAAAAAQHRAAPGWQLCWRGPDQARHLGRQVACACARLADTAAAGAAGGV
jgi:hypothetical protein